MRTSARRSSSSSSSKKWLILNIKIDVSRAFLLCFIFVPLFCLQCYVCDPARGRRAVGHATIPLTKHCRRENSNGFFENVL